MGRLLASRRVEISGSHHHADSSGRILRAVVRRETGGWRWPAIQFEHMTFLAYFKAFVVNH
jgi:hypothetical protein